MLKLLARLLTFLAALALASTAVEFGLRRASPDTLGYSVAGRRFVRVKEFTRDTIKNSLGFHDKEPLADPGDRTRVLLLGDSYVDSSTTSVDESIGPRLEARLNDYGSDTFEVVAVGRSGWGQTAQLRQLPNFLRSLSPDIVVTLFLSFNDITDDTPRLRTRLIANDKLIFRKRPGWSGLHFDEAPGLVLESSELNRFLSYKLALLRFSGRRTFDGSGSGIPFDYLVYSEQYDDDWTAAWKLKEEIVRSTAEMVRASGAKYLMVSASTPHGVLGNEEGVAWLARSYPAMRGGSWDLDKPDRLLAGICERAQIPFLALEEPFRRATANGAQLHWKYDGHWNAAGNDFAAENMAAFIISKTGR
jgi:hypothetical protein